MSNVNLTLPNVIYFFSFDEMLQRVLSGRRGPVRDRERDPADDGTQGQEGSARCHHCRSR
jgi:hypothetical protein